MPRDKIYVDSCVLIFAAKAKIEEEVTARALAALDRNDVDFIFSSIVELETMPCPMRNNKYTNQLKIFESYFNDFQKVPCDEESQRISVQEAGKGNGLSVGDALHVGCAIKAGADYILTAESPDNQMMQCKSIKFMTIHV